MELVLILLICATVFGLCWLVDKGFTKLFRSEPQHKSGLSVRLNKKFGSMGFILAVLGLAGLFSGISGDSVPMMVGSAIIILAGMGLVVYYLSTGIFYDDDSFLYASFGKKSRTYRYEQIAHQQLYMVQGGSTIIELHMCDGTAVQVLSQMPDYEKFLSHAQIRWCRQKGINVEDCDFLDPANSCWFPSEEVL